MPAFLLAFQGELLQLFRELLRRFPLLIFDLLLPLEFGLRHRGGVLVLVALIGRFRDGGGDGRQLFHLLAGGRDGGIRCLLLLGITLLFRQVYCGFTRRPEWRALYLRYFDLLEQNVGFHADLGGRRLFG